jgi:hypothetical protein
MHDCSTSHACLDTSRGRFHITPPLLILAHTSILKGTDFNHILKWDNFTSHPRQMNWLKQQISNLYITRFWVLATVLLKMQVLWDVTLCCWWCSSIFLQHFVKNIEA